MDHDETYDPPQNIIIDLKIKQWKYFKKNIKKYSSKMYTIINEIENSDGPIIIIHNL